MVTLKFPKLQNVLVKNIKDLPDKDPRRGIIIVDDNAIVLGHNYCFVLNLFDYFTIEDGIEDENELEELRRILFFMDGKIFPKDFWEELTKGANVKVKENDLFIENMKYSKYLHYKPQKFNLLEPLELLEKAIVRGKDKIDSIGFPFGILHTIYSVMPSDFKNDSIIFEFFKQEHQVKFTFRDRKYIYGYVIPDYDSVQGGFIFDQYEVFISESTDLVEDLRSDERKNNIVPKPPNEGRIDGIDNDANMTIA